MQPCNFCPSVIGLFHLAQGSHLISGPVSKRIETGISRRYLHSHSYGSISRKSQGVETTSCPLTYEWIKKMWHAYRTELLFIPKRRGYLAIRDNLNTFILKVTADFRLGQDRRKPHTTTSLMQITSEVQDRRTKKYALATLWSKH